LRQSAGTDDQHLATFGVLNFAEVLVDSLKIKMWGSVTHYHDVAVGAINPRLRPHMYVNYNCGITWEYLTGP